MSSFMRSDPATWPTQKLSLSTTSTHLAALRLHRANRYILRTLLSLASANLLIRIAGMFNQVLITYRFGQGSSMDAYLVASLLPALLAQLLASALEASVIPTYARVRTTGGKVQASRLFSTLLHLLIPGMLLLSLAELLLRRLIVPLSAAGLSAESLQLAIDLSIAVFPCLFFMVINSFLECLLNAEGRLGWSTYAGICVPLTTATMLLFVAHTQAIWLLCLGTLGGQIVQLIILICRAWQAGITYQPVLDLRSPALASILTVAWPALFSALISQASPLVDQIFASYLSSGSISALSYANKILSLFTGLFFSSAGRALLPYLARQAASGDMRAFKRTLHLYIWIIGGLSFLLTILLGLLAHPLVQLLFQRGAFTANATWNTSVTLLGLAVGLTPMALGFLLSKAFSALGKTRFLLAVTLCSILCNALLDAVLAHFWQEVGIALATSLAYLLTTCLLILALRRLIGPLHLTKPPDVLAKRIDSLWPGDIANRKTRPL